MVNILGFVYIFLHTGLFVFYFVMGTFAIGLGGGDHELSYYYWRYGLTSLLYSIVLISIEQNTRTRVKK